MKKVIAVLILSVLFSFARTLKASEETHKKTTDELIDAMEIKDMETGGFEQLKQRFMRDMEVMFADMDDTAKVQSIKEKVKAVLNKELSWENLKSQYVKLYMEAFTEEEMKVIIAFYKTPEGKKLMNKIPELMDRSMQIGELKTRDIMPEIMNAFRGKESGKQDQQKREMPKDQIHMKKK